MLVRSEVNNHVALVTIDNPPANSLGAQTVPDLKTVLEPLMKDDEVRVLVITGAGPKIFVAGADIKRVLELDHDSGREFAQQCKDVFSILTQGPKPVIAAINGIAAGGGLELAMYCDIRLCSDRARLGLPEVTLGVLPGAGGTQNLPRLIGPGRALTLMLTGELIKADRAEALGMVDAVYPAEEFMDRGHGSGRTHRLHACLGGPGDQGRAAGRHGYAFGRRHAKRDRTLRQIVRHQRQERGRGRLPGGQKAGVQGRIAKGGRT